MKNHYIFYVLLSFLLMATAGVAEDKMFVGAESCKECHEQEYQNFKDYAKKAHSFESIKKMEKKLTPEEYQSCFECHTTGYGRNGGFVSEEKTPHLMNAGCEVCHGPGSVHVESGDPEDIAREINMDNCNTCHSKDRIEAFDFKPLLFGGAH
jgi:hypothetical protein